MRRQELIVKRVYDPEPEVIRKSNLKSVYLLWIRDMYNDSSGSKKEKKGEVNNGKCRSNNSGFDDTSA